MLRFALDGKEIYQNIPRFYTLVVLVHYIYCLEALPLLLSLLNFPSFIRDVGSKLETQATRPRGE